MPKNTLQTTNILDNAHHSCTLEIRSMSLVPYVTADALQRDVQQQRQQEQISDTVIFLEHPAVITIGKSGNNNDVLLNTTETHTHAVDVVTTDRGGQVTLHSPGQLVGYMIIHLYRQSRALRTFIDTIQNILVHTLQQFGIPAQRNKEHVGVWVADRKIASIGITVNRNVTRHGFALNINNDLDIFKWIVPCGLSNIHMTSMQQELQHPVDMAAVINTITQGFIHARQYKHVITH